MTNKSQPLKEKCCDYPIAHFHNSKTGEPTNFPEPIKVCICPSPDRHIANKNCPLHGTPPVVAGDSNPYISGSKSQGSTLKEELSHVKVSARKEKHKPSVKESVSCSSAKCGVTHGNRRVSGWEDRFDKQFKVAVDDFTKTRVVSEDIKAFIKAELSQQKKQIQEGLGKLPAYMIKTRDESQSDDEFGFIRVIRKSKVEELLED